MNNRKEAIRTPFARFAFVLLMWGFSAFASVAQVEDFQLRLGASLSGDAFSNTKWGLEVQQRFRQNLSAFDQFLVEPGFSYRPYDFLKLGVGYRMVFLRNLQENYRIKQRIHFELRLSQGVSRFNFKYRTRLQYGFDDFSSLDGDQFLTNALIQRHLLGVDYDIYGSRFSPYVTFEFYHHINKKGGSMLTRNRVVIGTEYKISSHSSIDAYYILNKEVNVVNPITEYILGLSYGYRF